MRFEADMIRLYAVTDRTWLHGRTLPEVVEEALRGGVTMVQLREKNLPEEEMIREAKDLVSICHARNVPLVIDDSVPVCLASGADGVHVGQSDMAVARARELLGPDRIVGATAHNVEEAVRAQRDGADYLGSGAAFGSSTKKDASAIDRARYREITGSVSIPVCAIGGITISNISLLRGYGLKGAAIVSGIFAQRDIEAACRKLKEEAEQL